MVSSQEVLNAFESILEEEGIEATPESLNWVARRAVYNTLYERDGLNIRELAILFEPIQMDEQAPYRFLLSEQERQQVEWLQFMVSSQLETKGVEMHDGVSRQMDPSMRFLVATELAESWYQQPDSLLRQINKASFSLTISAEGTEQLTRWVPSSDTTTSTIHIGYADVMSDFV